MSKINEILIGWGNLIKNAFHQLDEETKSLSEKRLNICHSCDIRLGTICDPRKMAPHAITGHLSRGCGCSIAAKTMNINSKCPLGKW